MDLLIEAVEVILLNIIMVIHPSEKGKPFRYVTKKWPDTNILITTAQGEKINRTCSFNGPTFIFSDKNVTKELNISVKIPDNIAKIELESALLNSYKSFIIFSDSSFEMWCRLRCPSFHFLSELARHRIQTGWIPDFSFRIVV